ncbi:polysaccharide deacetylase family protein [Mariniluteicoccus flavus]
MRMLARFLLAVLVAMALIQPGRAQAYDVIGAIGEEWRTVSRVKVGEPITSEACWIRERGCFQHFERGSIYWTYPTGAHHVLGAIRERWAGLGWENAFVGYPTTGEECWIRERGCFQHFERGSIYWTYPTGAHPVIGAIRDHWAREGWENSRWGYPLGGEACRDEPGVRVCDQRFERGTITWRSDRGIVVGVDCAVQKCVALTYDDGPSAHTNRLLDTLGRERVKATFFVVGTMVDNNPAAVRRASQMGMEVGNHTMNHPNLSSYGYAAVRAQLDPVNDRILRHTGRRATWMRPPYGAGSPTVDRAAADTGQGVVLWNVDPSDWRDRDARLITDRVLRDVRPGAIVLMHDLHGTTVDAAPGIIAGLKAQGYQIVTTSELVGPAVPGRVYRSR